MSVITVTGLATAAGKIAATDHLSMRRATSRPLIVQTMWTGYTYNVGPPTLRLRPRPVAASHA